jgi:hypothetical protein
MTRRTTRGWRTTIPARRTLTRSLSSAGRSAAFASGNDHHSLDCEDDIADRLTRGLVGFGVAQPVRLDVVLSGENVTRD